MAMSLWFKQLMKGQPIENCDISHDSLQFWNWKHLMIINHQELTINLCMPYFCFCILVFPDSCSSGYSCAHTLKTLCLSINGSSLKLTKLLWSTMVKISVLPPTPEIQAFALAQNLQLLVDITKWHEMLENKG